MITVTVRTPDHSVERSRTVLFDASFDEGQEDDEVNTRLSSAIPTVEKFLDANGISQVRVEEADDETGGLKFSYNSALIDWNHWYGIVREAIESYYRRSCPAISVSFVEEAQTDL